MPPPVYVAVAGVVIVFAAAIAFKEFVYTPHIAPKVEAWQETRQRRSRRRQPAPVPASSQDSDDDDDKPPVRGTGADTGRPDNFGEMSVELQDLVASEQAEWQSSSGKNTLRQRRGRPASVLDESNVFVPYDPISPTVTASAASSTYNSPLSPGNRSLYEMTQVSAPPVIHSPMPRTPFNPSRLQTSIAADTPSPQLINPAGRHVVATPRIVSPAVTETYTARSASTASSFTPVVIGPSSHSSSPRQALSDFARSPTLSSPSPPRSPFVRVATSPAIANAPVQASQRVVSPLSASSPFMEVDTHPLSPSFGFNRSPSPILLSPQQSSMHLTGDSDFAILSPSLRSAMFSPSMSSFDGHFEIDSSFDGSDDGSDGSWNNVGDRTHSP
ncbi:hypothetical protein PHLGIDRAFT_16121 [Phlebiopsis gigantea 11061_1 CR5-6]|uniref:Uncharacterized protein n=1 Tax=Phlebiopsis gigantea (strain 11061_1 CR5-6) TaxID=745531 RepID=A0A0C3NEL6_PHLG1|nr:hypothetical protein PHLGIDRAFT_16121 [Phlebiopsis gigantea 11061_1 CR5-6]